MFSIHASNCYRDPRGDQLFGRCASGFLTRECTVLGHTLEQLTCISFQLSRPEADSSRPFVCSSPLDSVALLSLPSHGRHHDYHRLLACCSLASHPGVRRVPGPRPRGRWPAVPLHSSYFTAPPELPVLEAPPVPPPAPSSCSPGRPQGEPHWIAGVLWWCPNGRSPAAAGCGPRRGRL